MMQLSIDNSQDYLTNNVRQLAVIRIFFLAAQGQDSESQHIFLSKGRLNQHAAPDRRIFNTQSHRQISSPSSTINTGERLSRSTWFFFPEVVFFPSKASYRLALFPGQTMITPATQTTTMVVFIQLALKTVDYIIDFLKAILNQTLTGFE
jgi:hypothetical protein